MCELEWSVVEVLIHKTYARQHGEKRTCSIHTLAKGKNQREGDIVKKKRRKRDESEWK